VKGHKRFRSGAWRLTVFAGWDPVTPERIDIHETVRAPDNRLGAEHRGCPTGRDHRRRGTWTTPGAMVSIRARDVAATIGAGRGTIVALQWGNTDAN